MKTIITLLLTFMGFYVNAIKPPNDSLVYSLTNQIIKDNKIDYLFIKTGHDLFLDEKNNLKFDPSDAEFWLKKNIVNRDFKIRLKDIDRGYLTEQARSDTFSKWCKSMITSPVKFYRKGFFSHLRYWFSFHKIYVLDKPRYSISVPLFNCSFDIAFVFLTSYSGPESGLGMVLVYSMEANKWIELAEIPMYLI